MTIEDIDHDHQLMLQEEYQLLKFKVVNVDFKYSLNVNETELNFPESLGLEHLEFVPMTDEEVESLAQSKAEERMSARFISAERSYLSKQSSAAYAQARAEESNRQKLLEISDKYEVKEEELTHKLVNNGLWHSTIKDGALNALANAEQQAVEEQNTHYAAESDALQQKSDDILASYNQEVASLNQQRDVMAANYRQDYLDKQEKNRLSIEKYNNNVDKLESNYQLRREQALYNARMAEYNRSLNAARVYAALGEVGLQQQIISEKLDLCKRNFMGYCRAEAEYILSLDNFLQVNLENSYNTFVDWIYLTLRV